MKSSFQTERLTAEGWHDAEFHAPSGGGLPELLSEMLTPDVMAPLPADWHGAYSVERAREWIEARDAETLVLLVTVTETQASVGLVLLHESRDDGDGDSVLRLGYLIRQSEWGQGYATEVARGVVDWARRRGHARILAGVAADNVASVSVLEKAGFQPERGSTEPAGELAYQIVL